MLHPKNKAIRKDAEFWEGESDSYRKEIKRLKGSLAQIKKGNIPYDAVDAGSDEAFIEGIFNALPPNLAFLKQFKGTAIQYLKDNPQAKEQIIEVIKSKMGGKGNSGGENAAEQIDSL